MITKDQARMGRAAIDWTVRDLAKRAGLAPNTVNRYERGENSNVSTVQRIQETMEAEGVVFTPATDTLEPGVALKKDRPKP